MSSMLSPTGEFKITVKLTMRVPIKPTEDLLTRNLGDVYQICLRKLAGKHFNEKRFSTKLSALGNGLVLARGSWLHSGSAIQFLSYQNILQFSSCPNDPVKALLLITNQDRSRTELVAIKTKGHHIASQLLAFLHQKTPLAQNGLAIGTEPTQSMGPRPVSYQDSGVVGTTPNQTDVASSPSRPTTRPHRQAPVPPGVRNSLPPPSPRKANKGEFRVEPLVPEYPSKPQRTKKTSDRRPGGIAGESYAEPPAHLASNDYQENYSKSNSGLQVESLDSAVYYGQAPRNVPRKSAELKKQKKSKSRAPRELSNLGDNRNVSRELDANNTPWEVNICYIKHDPLVGCVEDESGPIYMYTAHQLVPQDDRDYDGSSSGDSDGVSTDDNNYIDDEDDDDDETDYENDVSLDENKKLEKFMMLDTVEDNPYGAATSNGGVNDSYNY